jgi:hypothetical protein
MSYFDDASLVMIPSGYKASKVYSVKPTDGTGDLTFTRSNDTATRVASNGLIEKVRTNVLLQSNSFDTTWFNTNSTETSGQSGYDGTNNAWLLNINAAAGRINQTISVSGIQTFSVYAKKGTYDFLALLVNTTTPANLFQFYDLNTGTLGTGSGQGIILDFKITPAANGFYRCSITINATTGNVRIYGCVADNDFTGTSGNILIQAAQLETGDIATDYIATTTAAVSVGPVANVPRLDYLGSSCPRLLLEPQRTNLALYSEQFDNAGWAKSGASVLANAVLGPDGYTSADKLVEDTSTGAHIATQSNLFTATGAWHTASIFVKAAERTYAAFSTRGNFTSNDNTLIFNLTTGEWELDDSGQNYALNAEAFPNGWYRISLNTDTTSGAYDGFGIGIATGSTSWVDAVYTGDGTSGIYIWGAQMEAGQYESSLIPTLVAAVTRGADLASKTGISSLIGSAAGTIYVEFSALANDLSERRIALSDGTTGNVARVGYTNASNRILAVLFNGANQCVLAYDGADITQTQKVAFTWAANDFALFVNGVKRSSDVSGTTFLANTLTAINFNEGDGAGNDWYGDVDQLLLFKSRLSDSDLAALTA